MHTFPFGCTVNIEPLVLKFRITDCKGGLPCAQSLSALPQLLQLLV
jgi:hypothetical protein